VRCCVVDGAAGAEGATRGSAARDGAFGTLGATRVLTLGALSRVRVCSGAVLLRAFVPTSAPFAPFAPFTEERALTPARLRSVARVVAALALPSVVRVRVPVAVERSVVVAPVVAARRSTGRVVLAPSVRTVRVAPPSLTRRSTVRVTGRPSLKRTGRPIVRTRGAQT